MGKVNQPKAAKLIIGLIFKKKVRYKKAKNILEWRFGKIDFESKELPFKHTDYYEKEFGKTLKRRFISFKKLIPPEKLPQIKILTNKIEGKILLRNCREVNIDPGYLNQAKLVLASTKDYRHRIYLDQGIYAEITLFYADKTFKSWEWTYPDYKSEEYIKIFNKIREIYVQQI